MVHENGLPLECTICMEANIDWEGMPLEPTATGMRGGWIGECPVCKTGYSAQMNGDRLETEVQLETFEYFIARVKAAWKDLPHGAANDVIEALTFALDAAETARRRRNPATGIYEFARGENRGAA